MKRVSGHVPKPPSDDDDQQVDDSGRVRSPLPAYAEDLSPEVKLEVESLIDHAFHKGVVAAAKQARKSNETVEDIFHDALAGKYYDMLKERGFFRE